jgi:hypothetical protein
MLPADTIGVLNISNEHDAGRKHGAARLVKIVHSKGDDRNGFRQIPLSVPSLTAPEPRIGCGSPTDKINKLTLVCSARPLVNLSKPA